MRKYVPVIIICFLAAVFTSCVNRYYVDYTTKTFFSGQEYNSNIVKDSLFEFHFNPVPNGVYLTIKNLTNSPASLEWDRCYFIEPNGNSFKSLNTDLLFQNSETTFKGQYQSIIPTGCSFSRFTTSSMNVSKFTTVNTIYFTAIPSSYTEMSSFYNYGRYWPNYKGPERKDDSNIYPDTSAIRIKNYLQHNNNMGIGICIKTIDTIIDYRFDFKITYASLLKESVTDKNVTLVKSIKFVPDSGWIILENKNRRP